jgi:SPP1 family predicted phage head-tail adaptor
MRAGKLRHYVQLLVPPDPSATDSQGDPASTFSGGPSFWCSIEPLTPREFLLASQIRADVTHKVTLRYRDDITARHRLKWGTRVFEVGPPLSTEERHFDLVLTAVEKWQ